MGIRTPCPSQNFRASVLLRSRPRAQHPSCNRIRKRLQLLPDALYGQPQSPEPQEQGGKVQRTQALGHQGLGNPASWLRTQPSPRASSFHSIK